MSLANEHFYRNLFVVKRAELKTSAAISEQLYLTLCVFGAGSVTLTGQVLTNETVFQQIGIQRPGSAHLLT
jgi:hypothetical protein